MKFCFLGATLFAISFNALAMELPTCSVVTPTPCPFINTVFNRMLDAELIKSDAEFISSQELVDFAVKHFALDRNLIVTLAGARADSDGNINLAELLDPEKFPAHRGSLARCDPSSAEEFACIEENRLNILLKIKSLSTTLFHNGTLRQFISYKQLKIYQKEFCWSQSDMRYLKDYAPAKAEIHLLWALFGAYRIKNRAQEELIPLDLVDNFLRNSKLPEDFQPNLVDPATRSSVAWAVITD